MKYELLEAWSSSQLSDLVNKRIEAGWLPLGTPFSAQDTSQDSRIYFLQAVILMEENDA